VPPPSRETAPPIQAFPPMPPSSPQATIVPSKTPIPLPVKTETGPGLILFVTTGTAAGIGLVRRRFWSEK
jgi:hypothetical protein